MVFLKKRYIYFILLLLMIVYVVFTVSRNSYLMFLFTLACINAIAVLGINIVSGYTGLLHLGQMAFVGIGAYTSALIGIKLGLSFWITLPFSIFLAAIAGALLGIPALKLRGGPYLALVTQTFGEIIYIIVLNWVVLTGGPFGLVGIKSPWIGPFEITGIRTYLIFCIIFLIISFLIAKQIINSRFGNAFISIRESEEAAQSIGINTTKYKIMAFALAAAFGGIAGTLYAPFIGYLNPEQFRWVPSIALISMAIVGGLNNLLGGIIGAFILTFLPELLRIAVEFRLILYGVLLIVTLTFLPNGLISLWGLSLIEIKDLFKKRMGELSGIARKTKTSKQECTVKR